MKNVDQNALERLIRLAEDAGRIVMKTSRASNLKPDGTDVTAADIASHDHIMAGIHDIFGTDASILSEEGTTSVNIKDGWSFVTDPLDGTANFKDGLRDFAVLIAILKDAVPVFGIAVAPAYHITACGGTLFNKAELRLHDKKETAVPAYRKIHVMAPVDNDASITIVPKRFIDSPDNTERDIIQSAMSDFKEHTINTRFVGATHIFSSILPVLKKNIRHKIYEAVRPNQRPGDWDVAAWDAILRGAGGIMTDREGKPLAYGRSEKEFKHQNFICWRKQSEATAYAARLADLKNTQDREIPVAARSGESA